MIYVNSGLCVRRLFSTHITGLYDSGEEPRSASSVCNYTLEGQSLANAVLDMLSYQQQRQVQHPCTSTSLILYLSDYLIT
jgi:hypothetical protein